MQSKHFWLLIWVSVFAWTGGFARPQQNLNDLERLLQELQIYTEAKIIPVMKIQRNKLNKYLTNSDLRNIAELSQQKQALGVRKMLFLTDKKRPADERMKEWEIIQQTQTQISLNLQGIVVNYQAIIQKLFAEVADKITLWREEMNQIVDKYNQSLDENQIRQFKKYGLGEFMQPDGFIIWNTLPKTQEGQAGDGRDE
jgi:Holliday junction resolvasome RuvABC ATP-dependent DNA helicase subunit